MALVNRAHRREVEDLVRRIEKVETAIEPRFQEHFVNAMGLPNRTVMVPGRMRSEPFGMTSRDPEIAAGTISTPDWIARTKAPFLKGCRLPSGDRVPSGNMMTVGRSSSSRRREASSDWIAA